MKVRRKLNHTLHIESDASRLFDAIEQRGELGPLLTLFIENIDTVMRMQNDKEYVTTDDFKNLEDKLLTAVAQVIQSKTIELEVKKNNALNYMESVKKDTIETIAYCDNLFSIEDEDSIQIETEESDDFDFELT